MTMAIRGAAVTRLYDIHIDEITYNHFALSINQGNVIPRLFDNQPFFLHPPVYYYTLAAWRLLVWPNQNPSPTGIFDEYYALRFLNVILAGMTVVLLYKLTHLATRSRLLSVMTALLFALDGLAIRQNTRSLMETITMLWLLLGLWCWLRRPTASQPWPWITCGLAFGLAIASKDTSAVFIVLLGFITIWQGLAPPRPAVKYLLAALPVPYAIWIGIVIASGQWTTFMAEKSSGLHRFVGVIQTTGYNSPDGPSKLQTLMQTIEHYGPAYAILGLGVIGTIALLASPFDRRRHWGAIGLASSLVLAYEFAFGTMEEQFLYYLLVPSFVIVGLAYQELAERLPLHRQQGARAVMSAIAVVLVWYSSVSYVLAMRTADHSWQRAITSIAQYARPGSTILAFGPGQFLFQGLPYQVSNAKTADQIKNQRVDYVIISKKLALDGYAPLSPALQASIYQHGLVLSSFAGRDSGQFDIIELTDRNAISGPSAQPPATPANQILRLLKYLAASAIAAGGAVILFVKLRRRRWRQRNQDGDTR
jgi:4-amino-4-deoxy-L-arabinose transferase-like glycosyltransferase